MAFILLILLVAIAISSTAAYFSVVGLAALFPATALAVIIMGTVLEVGKITSVKWLHSNWRNPSSPRRFKYLMCLFTAPLLIVTNIGIYGFLSKGHLEQLTPAAGQEIQIAQIQTQLDQKNADVARQQKRLDQISKINDTVLAGNARAGLRASNQNKRESAAIQKTIDEDNAAINDLNAKMTPLKLAKAKVDADLGPVKYVAALFGLQDETAVRIVICLIMSGFDTLALSLFIAFDISLKDHREKRAREKAMFGTVLPNTQLQTPMPPVSPPKPADAILEEMTPIEGEGASIEPLPYIESLQEHVQDLVNESKETKLEVPAAEKPASEVAAALADTLVEHEPEEARTALDAEKAEFDALRREVEQQFLQQAADLDKAASDAHRDNEALQSAHRQLVEMEERLNDEREILKQWEDTLTQQQGAINEWTPEGDTRSDKEKIISMLEKNPQVVNDIIETVDAMRHILKPGL